MATGGRGTTERSRAARTTIGGLASLALALAVAPGCSSPNDDRVDVCRDLGSFGETFELLLAPPPDATIGEVRGALEKIAPFLERVAAADATSDALDDELVSVEEAFRDALDGLGDDEPATEADAELRGDRPRLAALLAEASSALDCGAPAP
jgi:hypothetical protein